MRLILVSFVLSFTGITYANAQNVGIGTHDPVNKLHLVGSLLVHAPVRVPTNPPAMGQLFTMTNAGTNNIASTDSVCRIYDPGGPSGNYTPSQLSNANIASNPSSFGIEMNIESIAFGSGDSLIIKETSSANSPVLFAAGNNNSTAGKHVFSVKRLYLTFKSNSDTSTNAGFSLLFKRLFEDSSTINGNTGLLSKSLFFNSGNGAFRVGNNRNEEMGDFSIAAGNNNTAKGNFATAMGTSTEASGFASTALGSSTNATGEFSTAMGVVTTASGEGSVAMGTASVASGTYAMAMGLSAIASAENAVAIGNNVNASAAKSMALGDGSVASNTNATAIGFQTSASGFRSTAFGNSSTASGNSAIAMGVGSVAFGNDAIAIGTVAEAVGSKSTALGWLTTANGAASTAIGFETFASGDYAAAMGNNSAATGNNSIALGFETLASGINATAMGSGTVASSNIATAMGRSTNATGSYSTAIGSNTTASGGTSTAMGYFTTASGIVSTAMGAETTASGDYSTAIGNNVSTNNMEGALIIGDNSTSVIMNSGSPNTFRARFDGGYRFYTSSNLITYALLPAGANAWNTTSDARLKENFLDINGEDFLQKIAAMKLTSWNYKQQDALKFRHYGPMAQDFYASFGRDGIGTIGNDTTINQADFDGVNLVAIQALEKRTAQQQLTMETSNRALKKEIDELKARLLRLQQELEAIKMKQ